MQGKSTLKDLAKILNLSVSTVSKAINDSSEISERTKIKVRNVANLNNYSPNRLAQSLKANKTKTIGVIIPDVMSHFFAKAIHGIETKAIELGYNVVICLSNESLKKETESINTLINGSVDGLIISLSKETQTLQSYDHFESVLDYKLPLVLFDRISKRFSCDKINLDDKLASAEATNHLIKTGCKNIVFLSTMSGTSVGEKRRSGYSIAIKLDDLKERIVNIPNYGLFESTLIEVLKNETVDGIVAANELSAITAIKYALKHGYKIPQDISVIGFTNGILSENFIPSLTVVDQHAEEQGELAAQTLINRIEKKTTAEPVSIILKTTIVERESTRPIYYAK